MQYPDIITEDILEKNAHIPNQEIHEDIAATEREVIQLKEKMYPFSIVTHYFTVNKNDPLIVAVKEEIKHREEFILFLRRLLSARNSQCPRS